MNKSLHIVSFDVPWPADYGGVIDVFHRIKALHSQGVSIKLHCFEYGRGEQPELKNYCSEVHYYQRQEGHKGLSLSLPYIVASRSNAALWERLQQDNDPILLEGIHCTYGLHAGLLSNRKTAVRMHNVEHEYYHQLAQWERSLMKKAYYHHESRMLKRYEKLISQQSLFLAITDKDASAYRRQFRAAQVQTLPAFVPHRMVTSRTGLGTFVLYHGNLSVAENEKAAGWLLEKVFNDLEIPFVVAGKDPSPRLVELAHRKQHTCIVENPSESEMNDLIAKAQLHVLPAFSTNGIKLKLLAALFGGRHVVTNEEMVGGTGLEKACHLANNPSFFKYTIYRLFQKEFTDEDREIRSGFLQQRFDNNAHAQQLMQWLL